MKAEVNGVSETISYLDYKKKGISLKIADAMQLVGLFMVKEVQSSINGERDETASVDTGRFKSSVKSIQQKPDEVTIYSNVEYAKFLEYGTSKMAERRHFRNSAERNDKKIHEFVQREVNKI